MGIYIFNPIKRDAMLGQDIATVSQFQITSLFEQKKILRG